MFVLLWQIKNSFIFEIIEALLLQISLIKLLFFWTQITFSITGLGNMKERKHHYLFALSEPILIVIVYYL